MKRFEGTNYTSKLASFGERIATIEQKLQQLADQKREYALEVADNNPAAKKAVALIDQQAEALGRERVTLLDASEAAMKLVKQQEAAVAEQERAQQVAKAHGLIEVLLAKSRYQQRHVKKGLALARKKRCKTMVSCAEVWPPMYLFVWAIW